MHHGGEMVRPQQPTRARTAGFTLLELMTVVTIIGISIAIAAPAIGGAMADRRAGQAALDLVRLARHARSESVAYGRATLLRYQNTSNGEVRLYRGINNGCTTNDWDTLTGGPACGTTGSFCIDWELMSSADYSVGSQVTVMAEEAGSDFLDICYRSNGMMEWRTSASGTFSDLNTVQGGFRFTFTRKRGGSPLGVVRRIVIPFGGDARTLR